MLRSWLLGFAFLLPALAAALEPGEAAKKVRQIIAHRGSSSDRPENTLASYRRAIEVKATVVEIDVRTTRDGELISLHDATLDRTTSGKGPVNALTLAELQRLDAGSWFDPKFKDERVPTVRQILELCKGKIAVMLDLKETGDDYAEKVTAAVRKYGNPAEIVLGPRSVEQARQLRKLLPEAKQIGLIPTPRDIEAFAAVGVEYIRLWPKELADPELVKRIRKAGVKLHLGTAKGTKEEVLPLLPFEPDSLSSDDPAQLIQTLATIARK